MLLNYASFRSDQDLKNNYVITRICAPKNRSQVQSELMQSSLQLLYYLLGKMQPKHEVVLQSRQRFYNLSSSKNVCDPFLQQENCLGLERKIEKYEKKHRNSCNSSAINNHKFFRQC